MAVSRDFLRKWLGLWLYYYPFFQRISPYSAVHILSFVHVDTKVFFFLQLLIKS
jgi:hypothetical protein